MKGYPTYLYVHIYIYMYIYIHMYSFICLAFPLSPTFEYYKYPKLLLARTENGLVGRPGKSVVDISAVSQKTGNTIAQYDYMDLTSVQNNGPNPLNKSPKGCCVTYFLGAQPTTLGTKRTIKLGPYTPIPIQSHYGIWTINLLRVI